MEYIEALADGDLESRVLAADLPVIVVFTAEWCGPCKWLDPHLQSMAERAGGRVLFYRVDTDRSPGITRGFRVGSVPTVVLVRGGKEVERSVGVEPERLLGWIEPLLGKGVGTEAS